MMTSRLWTNKNRQKKTKSVTIAFVALRYANVCDEVSSIWRAGGNWGKWHVVLGHKATITMRRSERQPGTIWHVAERPTPPGTSVYPTGPPARLTQRSLSVRRTGQEIKSHTRRHARSHTYTWWGRGLLRHSRKEKGGSQSAEVVQCIQKRWELSASPWLAGNWRKDSQKVLACAECCEMLNTAYKTRLNKAVQLALRTILTRHAVIQHPLY